VLVRGIGLHRELVDQLVGGRLHDRSVVDTAGAQGVEHDGLDAGSR